MKKNLAIVLSVLSAVFILSACGTQKSTKTSSNASQSSAAQKGTLLMATTTSTQDTGLLDYIAPIFKKDTGWKLQWTAVGTGEALKMGQNGDVDVVLVHAKSSEEEFVKSGYGVKRFPVMYNDFVVVGPAKPLAETKDITALFTEINKQNLPFISRGDDSGTDKAEKKIWTNLKIDPKTNKNYIKSGQGMGDTITMANEKKAYCFTDRGTWLKMEKDSTVSMDLNIICQGDPMLKNQYGVIAINPAKYPKVNNKAANEFIKWICSANVQKLIGEYGKDKYGKALFTPNAGTNA